MVAIREGGKEGGSYSPAVSNRPPYHTPRIALGADLQREDLSRVQPRDREPGGAETDAEDEGEGGSGGAELGGFGAALGVGVGGCGEAAGEEHGDAHDDGAEVEGGAAAELVEGEDCEEG